MQQGAEPVDTLADAIDVLLQARVVLDHALQLAKALQLGERCFRVTHQGADDASHRRQAFGVKEAVLSRLELGEGALEAQAVLFQLVDAAFDGAFE